MADERDYPPIRPTLYRIIKAAFVAIFKLATRMHVSGLENVPESGPYIVVSNHHSYVDAPLVGIAFPHQMHALAAEKYEYHPFRLILAPTGSIFIERGEVDRRALRQALNLLADGEILAIAIEGTRSKTGGLIEGKDGVAYIASRANVPLLPIVVYGTEHVFHNLLRLRRTDVYADFGPLIHLPEGRLRAGQLTACTDQIMVTLAAMLPEQYRGIYTDHPLLKERLAANKD